MSARAVAGPFHNCIEYLASVTSHHVNVGDYLFYAEILKYISSVCFIYKVPGVNQECLDRLRHACEHFEVPPVDTLYDLYYCVDLMLEFCNVETEVLHDIYTCSNFGRVRGFIDNCSTEKIQDLLWFSRGKNERVEFYIRTMKGIVTHKNKSCKAIDNCYVLFLCAWYIPLGYIEEAQDKVFYDYIGDQLDPVAEYGSTCWYTREKYILAAKHFEEDIAGVADFYNALEDEELQVESFYIFTYCSVNRIRMSEVIF